MSTTDKTGVTSSPTDDPSNYVYPSKLRRFIMLVVWYFLTVLILMTLAHLIVEYVFNIPVSDNTKAPQWFIYLKYFIQLAPLPIFITMYHKGLLPGARRKRIV